MNRKATRIILITICVCFGASLFFFWKKNQEPPVKYDTKEVLQRNIKLQTVATGNIVPKEEIIIRPNISGVVEAVYVVAGQNVKKGDLIAKVKVIPNVSSLTKAKNTVASSKVSYETLQSNYKLQKRLLKRQEALFYKGIISENEYDITKNTFLQSKQQLDETKITLKQARENYEIIKSGSLKGLDNIAQTQIRATISGMVLEVSVKKGSQVIETNSFNEGSSIALIADVSQMIFEGKIDESEVEKINVGLPLEVSIGAIENKTFEAILDDIAPKGVTENGTIQFKIKGSIKQKDTLFIRPGLSANAFIILDKVENVLSIDEALLQYDKEINKPYVEVEKGSQKFEKRYVELGLSNGIYVEIKSGLSKTDMIKVWNQF